MPIRNRLSAIAFGLVLASVAALAQEAQKPAVKSQPVPSVGKEGGTPAGKQNPAPEQDDAAKFLPAIQGIESAIRDLIAEEDKVASEREEQREVADLKAQMDMARWAFWMLIATGATVILTGVGVVLIWRTLLYTRQAAVHAGEAVVEAGNATKAAQDAVEETRRIGEAQVRAYLTCVGGEFLVSARLLKLRLRVKNTGQSPAPECRILCAPFGPFDGNELLYLPGLLCEIFYVAASQEEGGELIFNEESGLISAFATELLRQSIYVSAECRMEWTDTFGKTQTQNFFLVEVDEPQKEVSPRPAVRRGKLEATNRKPEEAKA